jgi:hypothetical protein
MSHTYKVLKSGISVNQRSEMRKGLRKRNRTSRGSEDGWLTERRKTERRETKRRKTKRPSEEILHSGGLECCVCRGWFSAQYDMQVPLHMKDTGVHVCVTCEPNINARILAAIDKVKVPVRDYYEKTRKTMCLDSAISPSSIDIQELACTSKYTDIFTDDNWLTRWVYINSGSLLSMRLWDDVLCYKGMFDENSPMMPVLVDDDPSSDESLAAEGLVELSRA